jgi:hypothetical protein
VPATLPVPAAQLELLHRKVFWTYPPAANSARRPVRARVDDGLDYMLKDDSGGLPIRAREWICHCLADRAGIPVVEYRPVLSPAGQVLFGSKIVLNGGPGGTAFNMLAGTLPLAEASTVLSKIYAIDLLLGNGDRHPDNFMVETDGATPRIRVIDYSEAVALIDPVQRTQIPGGGTSTVSVGRALRNHYPFSVSAAHLALDRLAAVDSVKPILEEMPADWLPAGTRNEIAAWWLLPPRLAHIAAIRDGLSNGTLL